jgi:hypothetical protein
MRTPFTLGLLCMISISTLGQRKIIVSKFPTGADHFEYRLRENFQKDFQLTDISETDIGSKFRFRIDHNKMVEINRRSDDLVSGQIIIYTSNLVDYSVKKNKAEYEVLFISKLTMHPDTAKIISDLVKLNKIDSLSSIESESDWGPLHDGQRYSYVIEFSNRDIYSFKTYRISKGDLTTKYIDTFMRSMNDLLNLNSKLLTYINGLGKNKCYRIEGEVRKVVCPGHKKKEKQLNNES